MPMLRPDELDSIIRPLAQELDNDSVRGIFLTGSYARAAADAWSDIDLVCVTQEGMPYRDALFYHDSRLVSVSHRTLSHWHSVLADPDSALHAVAPFRLMRPLLDKDGAVRELHERAKALNTEADAFREKAGRRAAGFIFHQTEVVHKVMSGLELKDELRVLTYTLELLHEMARAVMLLRAVPITSGNTYFAQLLDAAGQDSAWSRAFRRAAGLTGDDLWRRGRAAVELYLETAALATSYLTSDEHEVVSQLGGLIE